MLKNINSVLFFCFCAGTKVIRPSHGPPNRPFAQLLPGLETGHPMTVDQSPAYDFSVSDEQKGVFLSPFRTVLSAIHMQVTDRPSPNAPISNPGSNCANGLFK